ncbi:MAG: hypothetical protein ACE5FJ_05990 [Gemmatimonadales bacterium]
MRWPVALSRPLPVVVLPLLLALGAYLSTIGHGFVYDDLYVIVDRPELHSLGGWGAWHSVLSATWWGNELYRPLTMLTFAVDWTLSGGNAAWFHFVNVLLHVLVTGLVFRLACRFIPPLPAAVAASLFAVHPVHVEAVASVVGRAEILATLFVLLAALAYLKDGDLAMAGAGGKARVRSTVAVLSFSLLAYASKESAFTLAGVLVLCDWIAGKTDGVNWTERLGRHGFLALAGFALVIEWMILRSYVTGGLAGDHAGAGLWGEGLLGRIEVMAPVFVEWVRLLVFPLHLSADYSPNYLPQSWSFQGVVGVVLLCLLTITGVAQRKSRPLITFGLAWLGGTLLVVSNILVPTGIVLAERSLYLPSVGFCVLAGVAAGSLRFRREAAVGVVALIVAAGLGRTLSRVPVWRDANSFFPSLVEDARGSFRSYWVAGMISFQRGDRDRGDALMRHAIDVYPVFPALWHDFATVLEGRGDWEGAARYYTVAFDLTPIRYVDAINAVTNYIRAEALDSARAVLHRARDHFGFDYRLKILAADIEMAGGRPMHAMGLRRLVAFEFPGVWQYWYLTAEAAVAARYCPGATRALARMTRVHSETDDPLRVLPRYEDLACES